MRSCTIQPPSVQAVRPEYRRPRSLGYDRGEELPKHGLQVIYGEAALLDAYLLQTKSLKQSSAVATFRGKGFRGPSWP